MKLFRRAPWMLVASFALAACGGGADETTDGAETAEAEAPALACFVQGETMEQAAARPSPLGTVEFTVGDAPALFCYGRPSARERQVMGGLVPFGEPWRTGANEATQLHLGFDATVGGVEVPAGSYSIFTVPGETEWEVVINRQVERWGIPIGPEVRADDVGSFMRPVAATAEFVETFTVTWESHGEGMGHLVMEWEGTRVEIPVHAAGVEHDEGMEHGEGMDHSEGMDHGEGMDHDAGAMGGGSGGA